MYKKIMIMISMKNELFADLVTEVFDELNEILNQFKSSLNQL